MFPENTVKMYNNLTPRKSRMKGVNEVVVFGIQYWVIEYLIKQWNENFFGIEKDVAVKKYKRMMDATLGKDSVPTNHIEAVWDLGYLPLQIKALPEGSICPIGVPCLTYTNTHPAGYFIPGMLETILSCTVWQPITSATIALQYKKLLDKYALETTGSTEGVQWQGHDFSMRGMSSLESATTSGAGHLLSFTGTDTIPSIQFLEQFYGADVEKELVGASVPATEHSVMCMGTIDDEIGTFERLLDLYPRGVLSVVSDTWDLWKVCTEYLPQLKEKILARDGKLVIRPDSGDPVDIICGKFRNEYAYSSYSDKFITKDVEGNVVMTPEEVQKPESKGVIELLWDIFGGTLNEQGYKVLDPHIGAIYGDSITLKRAEQICERLKAKGFASTNIVFGIGSFTYQYNTRDTFGFAVKATYGEVAANVWDEGDRGKTYSNIECREIWKDPITDDGTKKSAKGLLLVYTDRQEDREDRYALFDRCTKEEEEGGELETIFLDGKLIKFQTLSEIRNRLHGSKR